MNTISQTQVLLQDTNNSINAFLKKYKVAKLLRCCNAYKSKGFAVIDIFRYLLECMFSPISTYMSMRIKQYKEPFSKNTIYRFCNKVDINWHKFIRILSEQIISQFFRPLTSESRIEYFIFDDTPFAKFGHKTELVSKYFNHVNMKYEYGFRILSMLWTDGYSNIPIDFCPLASNNQKLILCPAKKFDKRSLASKIRKEAQLTAPVLIHKMIVEAKKVGHSAKYVLFDSWFATPKCITDIKSNCNLDVIAMVKKSNKIFYEYNNSQMDIKKIYSANKKRPGKSKYLLSVNANIIQKEKNQITSKIPVRIVYVRNKSNKKDWIALISTDINISEEEIIRRYGNRWNIEVYFKTCKQYLKMLDECHSLSFDAMTCHLTIVCVRYIILSIYQRANSDNRSLGELFLLYTAEVSEISFNQALKFIMNAILSSIRTVFITSEELINNFVNLFLNNLPIYLKKTIQSNILIGKLSL